MGLDFRQQAFLDWLCTPVKEREPRHMKDLEEQLGVTRRTMTNWKVDREFLEEWERRYLKEIGNPERKSEIMDTLYKTAIDPDDPKHVQAAKQYFEIEGSLKPAQMEVSIRKEASELTDEQLAQVAAMKANDMLAARRSEREQGEQDAV